MNGYFYILNFFITNGIILTNVQPRNPWAHLLSIIIVGTIFHGIYKFFTLFKKPIDEVKLDEEKNDEVKLKEIYKDEELITKLEIDLSPKVISKTITITNSLFSKKIECIKLEFSDGISGKMFHVVSDKYYYFQENNSEYQNRYKNYSSCKNAIHHYITKNEILKINFFGTFLYNSPVK